MTGKELLCLWEALPITTHNYETERVTAAGWNRTLGPQLPVPTVGFKVCVGILSSLGG